MLNSRLYGPACSVHLICQCMLLFFCCIAFGWAGPSSVNLSVVLCRAVLCCVVLCLFRVRCLERIMLAGNGQLSILFRCKETSRKVHVFQHIRGFLCGVGMTEPGQEHFAETDSEIDLERRPPLQNLSLTNSLVLWLSGACRPSSVESQSAGR